MLETTPAAPVASFRGLDTPAPRDGYSFIQGLPEAYLYCTNCSAELPDDARFCQRCGWDTSAVPTRTSVDGIAAAPALGTVQLSFMGSALEYLGWLLLSILSAIVVVPLAWVWAGVCRWLCRNLRFSDGTTVEFTGTGSQIVVWVVFYLLFILGSNLFTRSMQDESPFGALFLSIVAQVVAIVIAVIFLQWFVYNLKLSTGPALTFTGSFLGMIGYTLLIGLAALTIVGWAWAVAAQYRWIARHVEGRGVAFDFLGQGHQILWRVLVVVLLCCLIVPIPWAVMWLMRWLIENISMTRRAPEDDLFSDLSGKRRPEPSPAR